MTYNSCSRPERGTGRNRCRWPGRGACGAWAWARVRQRAASRCDTPQVRGTEPPQTCHSQRTWAIKHGRPNCVHGQARLDVQYIRCSTRGLTAAVGVESAGWGAASTAPCRGTGAFQPSSKQAVPVVAACRKQACQTRYLYQAVQRHGSRIRRNPLALLACAAHGQQPQLEGPAAPLDETGL